MIRVLKSGFFTTVQDLGRFGYRNKGVPVAGAMDVISVHKLNKLLENDLNAPVLEITMTGPELLFEEDTFICISGALLSPSLNGTPITNYQVIPIVKGDLLSFGKLQSGFRCYLGVKGGLHLEEILGSRSFYHPITKKKCIHEGDEIPFVCTSSFEPRISGIKISSHLNESDLEVSRGPEFDLLDDRQLEMLFSKRFSVSKENNRMAYQLDDHIDGHSINMLTSGTLPGTVQLTPAGKLIVLMKDGQTTGGYPRIVQLTQAAICVLAQKKFADQIAFKLV
ncbi:MAG: biotin-dependent carboxyltransferase family protein [Bacteroidota bacterium]